MAPAAGTWTALLCEIATHFRPDATSTSRCPKVHPYRRTNLIGRDRPDSQAGSGFLRVSSGEHGRQGDALERRLTRGSYGFRLQRLDRPFSQLAKYTKPSRASAFSRSACRQFAQAIRIRISFFAIDIARTHSVHVWQLIRILLLQSTK